MKISKKRLKQIIAEELSLLEAEEPKEEKSEEEVPVSTYGMIDNLSPLLARVTLSKEENMMFLNLMRTVAEVGNSHDIANDPTIQSKYRNFMNVLKEKSKGGKSKGEKSKGGK